MLALCIVGCGVSRSYIPNYIGHSEYIDGLWGNWRFYDSYPIMRLKGTPSNFVIYSKENHPSDYVLRIITNSYSQGKPDEWQKSTGTVEFATQWYAINPEVKNEYSSAFHYFLSDGLFGIGLPGYYRGMKRETEYVRINIMRKKGAYVYNIFKNGKLGFALQIPDSYFSN